MKRVRSIRDLREFVRDWCWSLLVGVMASTLLFRTLRSEPRTAAPKPPPPAPSAPPPRQVDDRVDALRYAGAAATREQLRKQLEALLGGPVRLVDFAAAEECLCPKCTERRNSRRPN